MELIWERKKNTEHSKSFCYVVIISKTLRFLAIRDKKTVRGSWLRAGTLSNFRDHDRDPYFSDITLLCVYIFFFLI